MGSLIEGAQNDTVIDNIRRFLPPAYRNKPGWEALVAAMAAGDEIVRDNVYKAFAQLFISSASGQYLIQRAADRGIEYPDSAGLDPELFRELAILLSTERQVAKALIGILEVFYGYDATRAHVTSVAGPYDLTVGDTLTLVADDRHTVTITVSNDDYANINAATPTEVAAVISRAFYEAGSKAFAQVKLVDGTERVVVYSGAAGLLGSIRATDGFVNRLLQFQTHIPFTDTWVGNQFSAEKIGLNEYRLTWTQVRAPGNFYDVQTGDYITIDAAGLAAIRGSYPVVDVHIESNLDPLIGYANLSWVTFRIPDNFGGPAGPVVFHVDADEIVFFNPTRMTVAQNGSPAFVAQHSLDAGIDIIMPATTQAVARAYDAAAYLHDTDGVAVEHLWRRPDGVVVVLGAAPTFSIGQMVELRGCRGRYEGVLVPPAGSSGDGAGGWDVRGPVASHAHIGGMPANAFFIRVHDPRHSVGHGIGGFAYPMTAPSDDGIGPYVFDNTGYSITSVATTNVGILAAGRGVSTLEVGSTAGFLNEESWLVIGFGTEHECGPVRCLGVIDGSNLAIDRSFIFPKTIPAGTSVTLLSSRAPFNPDNGAKSFVLTDSVAGRVAAEGFLDETVATGIPINKLIQYPGDRGLGGEGDPTTGIYLSDKVAVWASDDVDATVEAAHNAQ